MKTLITIFVFTIVGCAVSKASLKQKMFSPEKGGVVVTDWNRFGSREEASKKASVIMNEYCAPQTPQVISENDVSYTRGIDQYGNVNYDYQPHIKFVCK